MRQTVRAPASPLLWLAAALALVGCSGTVSRSAAAPGSAPGASSGGSAGTSSGQPGTPGLAPTGAADAGAAPLPPEKELESSYESPVATGRYVWIANPTSGRVAYVDAATLSVKTVEAGNAPKYLAALPGKTDAVIVLNRLSNDATVLTTAASGALTSRTIPGVVAGANAWAISSDGRWAIAWTDARAVTGARPTEGFQDATVIDLANPDAARAHITLAVGFRPVSFSFSADGKRAFAVTEDGISVIALGPAGPATAPGVALAAGTGDAADARDVSLTSDGHLAVVRVEGSSVVGIIDLTSGARTDLTLSGAVTDLDLAADGSRAVAVVRDTAEVAIIPLAGAAPAAAAVIHLTLAGETIGQTVLTADGKTAVLYSNAIATERLAVVDLGATPPTWHPVRLHAPVLSVLPTPDGQYAVVLHPADGDPSVNGSPDGGPPPLASLPPAAFSLVPLDGTSPARIQTTDAPIQAVAIAPGSDRALLTVRDDGHGVFGVYLAFFPTLEVRRYPLASPPIATGVVAGAGRGYVAQQHPEGRITFVTLDSGEARSLTGYELGARVVDWSQP